MPKTSQLPSAVSVKQAALIPLVQGGVTRRATAAALRAFAYRDLQALSADEVDRRILGVTAGVAAQSLFTTRNDTTASYVRSTAHFAADVDLTCISVWNDSATALQTATLISPRHVLLANHYYPAHGTAFRFVATNGTVVTRTLSDSARIGSTDIRIGYLSSDVPATISFASVLQSAQESVLGGCPVVYTDQNQKLFIAEADLTTTAGFVLADESADSVRAAFYKLGVTGDSSHPWFALLDGQACLLGSFVGPDSAESIAAHFAAINTAMGSLGGSYRLTPFASSSVVHAQHIDGVIPAANLKPFGGAGTDHSAGIVPDPGVTPDNTKFLRMDGSFASPAVVTQSDIIITQSVSATTGSVTIADGTNVVIIAPGTALTGVLTLTLPLAANFPATKEITIIDPQGRATLTNYIAVARAGSNTINGGIGNQLAIQAPYGLARITSDGVSKVALDGYARNAGNIGFSLNVIGGTNTFNVLGQAGQSLLKILGDNSGSIRQIGFFNATPISKPTGNIQTALANYGLVTTPTIFSAVPASASATGTAGEVAYDTSYLYVCVATDTWLRVAIATW